MPRVIYPLGASSGSTRRNRSVEKANGNGDSFLDTSHPLQLSVPRIEITLRIFLLNVPRNKEVVYPNILISLFYYFDL